MKRGRLKIQAGRPHADDLSFLPPYSEQAKYLLLADKFLSTNGARHNVVQIESSRYFHNAKKRKKAA